MTAADAYTKEVSVLQENMKPQKSWKDIAKCIINERDSEKLGELANELIEALNNELSPLKPIGGGEEAQRESA
jgi:hypothetical protein